MYRLDVLPMDLAVQIDQLHQSNLGGPKIDFLIIKGIAK